MVPIVTAESEHQGNPLRAILVIAGAIALAGVVIFVLLGRPTSETNAAEDTQITPASTTDDAGSTSPDPDLDGAFDPVDTEPAPQPTTIPGPTPPSEPPPFAPPPAPPSLGSANDCPGYQIRTPAMIVWGLEDPDGVLNGRVAPSLDAPVVRTFARDAMTQTITGGCKPDEDGTPWLEYMDREGALSFASSKYLRPATLVCLRGRVEGRAHPLSEPDSWFDGPIDGHGFTDGGEYAAFIPNEEIGTTDTYRLVPAAAVSFAGSCRG